MHITQIHLIVWCFYPNDLGFLFNYYISYINRMKRKSIIIAVFQVI